MSVYVSVCVLLCPDYHLIYFGVSRGRGLSKSFIIADNQKIKRIMLYVFFKLWQGASIIPNVGWLVGWSVCLWKTILAKRSKSKNQISFIIF